MESKEAWQLFVDFNRLPHDQHGRITRLISDGEARQLQLTCALTKLQVRLREIEELPNTPRVTITAPSTSHINANGTSGGISVALSPNGQPLSTSNPHTPSATSMLTVSPRFAFSTQSSWRMRSMWHGEREGAASGGMHSSAAILLAHERQQAMLAGHEPADVKELRLSLMRPADLPVLEHAVPVPPRVPTIIPTSTTTPTPTVDVTTPSTTVNQQEGLAPTNDGKSAGMVSAGVLVIGVTDDSARTAALFDQPSTASDYDPSEHQQRPKPRLTLLPRALDLPRMKHYGHADPLLEVWRWRHASWEKVAMTEVCKHARQPTWLPVKLRLHSLYSDKRRLQKRKAAAAAAAAQALSAHARGAPTPHHVPQALQTIAPPIIVSTGESAAAAATIREQRRRASAASSVGGNSTTSGGSIITSPFTNSIGSSHAPPASTATATAAAIAAVTAQLVDGDDEDDNETECGPAEHPLLFRVMDWTRNGQPVLIGEVTTSLAELLSLLNVPPRTGSAMSTGGAAAGGASGNMTNTPASGASSSSNLSRASHQSITSRGGPIGGGGDRGNGSGSDTPLPPLVESKSSNEESTLELEIINQQLESIRAQSYTLTHDLLLLHQWIDDDTANKAKTNKTTSSTSTAVKPNGSQSPSGSNGRSLFDNIAIATGTATVDMIPSKPTRVRPPSPLVNANGEAPPLFPPQLQRRLSLTKRKVTS
jgi:type II secretory pathway pseudopilin PulG